MSTRPRDEAATEKLETSAVAEASVARAPVAVDDVHLAPGTRLAGRYRIERFVASGGMGDVYEATDTELRARLAVKTVRRDVASDPSHMERVRREVQLARTVTDPHVCRLFDIGHADVDGQRVTFITMELLTGETLKDRVRRATFTTEAALPLAGDLIGGLAACHRAGVIHRDLKAENVLLVQRDDREHAVITDFGIAQADDAGGGERSALTQEGTVIGSPAFMAPEQVEGQRVTPRTDIYALGAVLYELVLGPWPLRGMPTLEILSHVVRGFPANADFPAGADPRWCAVIRRCRAIRPAERFGAAMEVLAALRTGVGVRADPPTRRRRWPWAAAALLAGASVSIAAWHLHEPDRLPVIAAAVHAPPTEVTVATVQALLDRLAYRGAAAAAKQLNGAGHQPGIAAYLEARAAAGLGKWEAATVACRRALASGDPGITRAMRLQLEALVDRAGGDLEAPLALYEALHAAEPEDVAATLQLAEALIPLGRDARATEILTGLDQRQLEPLAIAHLALTRALRIFNTVGFDQAELQRLAEAAITAAHPVGASVIEGRALVYRASAQVFQGRPDAAKIDLRQARALLTAADDPVGLAFAYRIDGVIAANADNDVERMLASGRAASAINRQVDDRLALALSLNVEGSALSNQGKLAAAAVAYQASIEAALAAHREDIADTRARPNLATDYSEVGKVAECIRLILAVQHHRGPDRQGIEESNLSATYLLAGDLEAARLHARNANQLFAANKHQAFRSNLLDLEADRAFETDDQAGYADARRQAVALAKVMGEGEADFKLIISDARVRFARGAAVASAPLVAVRKSAELTPQARGIVGYFAARALLAEGKRGEAEAVRAELTADPLLEQYGEVRLLARLMGAELATTSAELDAAATELETARSEFERDGYAVARWEAAIGLATLAHRRGQDERARALALAVARETRAAGYLRLSRTANALAR